MKKVFSVLLTLLVTVPVMAQSWGPLTLPQPTAADDLKYVQWNATTRRYQLSTVAVSADNVIGNEVLNATDATLTRSGSRIEILIDASVLATVLDAMSGTRALAAVPIGPA